MTGFIRSSLARHQPVSPMADDEIHRAARRAWREQGVICLRLNQIDDEWTRMAIEAEALRLYGPRESDEVAKHGAD